MRRVTVSFVYYVNLHPISFGNKFMKIRTFFLIGSLGIMISSCSHDNNPDDPGKDSQEIYVDLSKDELANCYIVQSPGKYKFTADNQFNLGEGLPVPPEIKPTKAGLVWQTEFGSINEVNLSFENEKPYVTFEVDNVVGNAVIAVYNEAGKIEWSWHIWMPQEEVESFLSSTGYEVMNMNLGAMNNIPGDPLSYGMLYQWGRKDPFPASATLTGTTQTISAPMYDITGNAVVIENSDWGSMNNNTLEYAISHPTVCLSNYAQYANSRDWLVSSRSDDSLWGNPDGNSKDVSSNNYPNKGRKTCYDPSPAGWRVPPVDVFRNFTNSGGYAWTFDEFNVEDVNKDGNIDLDDYNYGWFFNLNDNASMYFPAAARFDGSYAMLMGSMSGLWGNYWSNAPYEGMKGGAISVLAFQVKDQYGNEMITVSPSAASSRADAFSIRCIRD